jgi:hypothetical protein
MFLTGALMGTFMTQVASASITFSAATAFSADPDGTFNNAGITTTTPCCQIIDIEQGTFTADANLVALPITLALGTNVFFLESGNWSDGLTTGGLNLYFNGDTSLPDISAHTTPTGDQTDFPAFVATASGIGTADLTDNTTPASGLLTFDDGVNTVTLTGFQWVYAGGADPYATSLTVQRITLEVTADQGASTPEPSSLLLIGGGLAAVGIIRRRRRA